MSNDRKQRDECWFSYHFFLSKQPGTPVCVVVQPTFRTSLPTSMNPLEKLLTDIYAQKFTLDWLCTLSSWQININCHICAGRILWNSFTPSWQICSFPSCGTAVEDSLGLLKGQASAPGFTHLKMPAYTKFLWFFLECWVSLFSLLPKKI